MNLFDMNVLLGIAAADPTWLPWSEMQFRAAAAQGPILICCRKGRLIHE